METNKINKILAQRGGFVSFREGTFGESMGFSGVWGSGKERLGNRFSTPELPLTFATFLPFFPIPQRLGKASLARASVRWFWGASVSDKVPHHRRPIKLTLLPFYPLPRSRTKP